MRTIPLLGVALASLTSPASAGGDLTKLLPNDPGFNEGFGSAVAIDGSTVLVGSPDDEDNGVNSGAAGHGCANGALAAQGRLLGGDVRRYRWW